jgi:hypothetical protein
VYVFLICSSHEHLDDGGVLENQQEELEVIKDHAKLNCDFVTWFYTNQSNTGSEL